MRYGNRFEEFDRAVGKRIDEIFGDPSKHKFYSEYDAFLADPHYGPRGRKVMGRKTICYHCGCKPKIHAQETEQL